MKNLTYILIAIAVFAFTSCENPILKTILKRFLKTYGQPLAQTMLPLKKEESTGMNNTIYTAPG
jgi:hypothetical protein